MNRIVILGPSGTGKTTIGRLLGKKYNLKILHLDSVYWTKNWEHISKEEFDEYMKKFFNKHKKWAIDGNYQHNRHFEYRLRLADTIIFLDFGTQASLKGIHQRAREFKHTSRADMGEGCIEGIDQVFLQWVAFYENRGRKLKAIIKKFENKKKVLIFKSRQELNDWFNSL